MQIPGYHIEREIGRGGMSIVYLAVQESLNRPVALKIMSPVLATDPQFAKRFVKEGVTVARLAHRGIIKVFDTGVYENNYYLSMEYLPGGTLADRLKQGLPLKEGLAILRTVADALGYAHRAGVVHRDVKPQNILFYGDGSPVVTDFGIAKTYENATVMTATGLMVGSPNYMSPEQIKGTGVDSKSDLYALGIIFHEILTGTPPYSAPDSFALAIQHLNNPIPQLPSQLAHFQPLLEHLLAKDSERRCPSAEQFIAALDRAERRAGALPSGPPRPGPDRRGGLGMAAALVLALLAGGGGAWWYYGQPAPAAEEPTAATTTPAPDATAAPQTPDIAGLLITARRHVDAGRPELALERLAQALALDPGNPEARALQRQAEHALSEQTRRAQEQDRQTAQRRQAEVEQRRQAEVEQRRQADLERRRQDEAEQRRLEEEDARRRQLALEYQRLEEERRRLEEERRRFEQERDRRLTTALAAEARAALAADDPDTALERLERALTLTPDHAESQELRRQALADKVVAERRRLEAERRRLADQERLQQQDQQRRAQVSGLLDEARRLRDQGELVASLAALDRGLAAAPGDAQLTALRRAVQEQITAPENDLGQEQRRKVQLALTFLGYDTQGIDGLFGGNTRKAIDAYQQANRLPRTGYLDAAQVGELLSIAEEAMRRAGTRQIPDQLALADPQMPTLREPAAPAPEPISEPAPEPISEPAPESEPDTGFSLLTSGESGGVRRRIVNRTVTELEAPPPKLVAVEQPLLPASADRPMTAAELDSLDDCWAQRGSHPAPSASILCVRQGQARVRIEEQGGVCQSYGPVRVSGLGLNLTAQSSGSSPACRVETVRFDCTDIRQITMRCTVELHYPAGAYAGASPRRDNVRFVRAVNAAASR